jgi:hypothetical protein
MCLHLDLTNGISHFSIELFRVEYSAINVFFLTYTLTVGNYNLCISRLQNGHIELVNAQIM